jgi:aminoglycoside phosphotransferase (APT) family kinase protein
MLSDVEKMDPVDAILAAHGFSGAWTPLGPTGVANRIYATADVVLRVATDHPDAESDARTESVAAPAARDAGIRTPRLLAFDDSRTLIDRPFSIWERIHGETLGRTALDAGQRRNVWCEVGQELAKLHDRVRACPDPCGYLDAPGYELDLMPTVARLVDVGAATSGVAHEVRRLIDDLGPHVSVTRGERYFVHNDLHEMNVMCTRAGGLLALIDWGDAGWGDPALDFVGAPLQMTTAVFEGYGLMNRVRLGSCPEARIVWAKLHEAMDAAINQPGKPIPVSTFRRYLDHQDKA